MPSLPSSTARSKAATVFPRSTRDAPRWAMTSVMVSGSLQSPLTLPLVIEQILA